jgi:predicted nucleic acid-binding protein
LNLIEFPKAIEFDLQVLFPSKSDYYLSLRISTELQKAGKPIPAVDSLIAAIGLNNKLKLVTRDNHFLLIEKIMKDFKVDVV